MQVDDLPFHDVLPKEEIDAAFAAKNVSFGEDDDDLYRTLCCEEQRLPLQAAESVAEIAEVRQCHSILKSGGITPENVRDYLDCAVLRH